MQILRYDIQFSSFTKKKLPKIDDRFGVYFVTGKQGSGKSYYAINILLKQDKKKVNKIKTNMHSLIIPGYTIEYFTRIVDIYTDIDDDCIYVIDEISRKYDKNSRTDTQFYAWLNQSRKRRRIVILITQEWKEVPMWLRRPAKLMITSIKVPLLNKLGLSVSSVGDAENMVLDKDEMEWTCPVIKYVIYKRNQLVASYYDTFEAINEL